MVVPYGVTGIYSDYMDVRSITIPDTVTTIDSFYFLRGFNTVNCITIGANVIFRSMAPFEKVYRSNGRKAGRYTRNDNGTFIFNGVVYPYREPDSGGWNYYVY